MPRKKSNLAHYLTLAMFGVIVLSFALPTLAQKRRKRNRNKAKKGQVQKRVEQQGQAKAKQKITGGYVLTHEHPTQGMAFGGNYAFAGKAGNYKNGIMEKGYTKECGGCQPFKKCDHGEAKGNFTASVLGALGRDMGDHGKQFGPSRNSFSHLRYSTEWIKEAFDPPKDKPQDTRMKIMVAFAVESEAMCQQLYEANEGGGGAGGKGYGCSKGDSLKSLERQINAIKAWVSTNKSWMQIAYSGSEARQIVNNGKLAIILGVEADYAFGAENKRFDPVKRLDRYHEMGVRTFYLAHKINSRLAGADIYKPGSTDPGKAIRTMQALAGCFYFDDNVAPYPLIMGGHNYCQNNCGNNHFKDNKLLDKCNAKMGDISEANLAAYIKLYGNGAFNGFKIYPLPPGFKGKKGGSDVIDGVERNNLGLSHDGERVVRAAMLKGMIVNIDHVSSKARKEIYDISRNDFGSYPLNALHNNPNERLTGKDKAHEYDFDKKERLWVRDTGGFFGVRVGPFHSKPYKKSGVTAECKGTATETAKLIAFLLDEGQRVGYSLDYATTTEGFHSRTYAKCQSGQGNKNMGPDVMHQYNARHVTDGLSHIGMMPMVHKEFENVGLKKRYLKKLKNNGAEQFVAMWERSEAKSSLGKQIERQTFTYQKGDDGCTSDKECKEAEFCGDPVAGQRKCKVAKAQGQTCTADRQCTTKRCARGFCGRADECYDDNDCKGGFYCGDPVGGRKQCKAQKSLGSACTEAHQCESERCNSLKCAVADECQKDGDCKSKEFCGDPVAGQRKCKALLTHGSLCTKKEQCATGRCSWGKCADADECKSSGDCKPKEFCGDPVGGKAKCKKKKSGGKACTTGKQCSSGRCTFFTCKK